MQPDSTCLNCGTTATGTFCHACGQKLNVERITWRWIVHQVPHVIWHFERGLFPTLIGLYLRPGQVIRDYWRGIRTRTMNPLSLLVVMVAISALNTALFAPGFEDAIKLLMPDSNPAHLHWQRFNWKYPLAAQIVTLPFLALATLWCFGSFGRTYGEHLVMNTFMLAALFPLSLPTAWLLGSGVTFAAVNYLIGEGVALFIFATYLWVTTFWPLRAPDDTRFEMVMRCVGAIVLWALLQSAVTALLHFAVAKLASTAA